MIATRRSRLALAQSELVAGELRRYGHSTELLPLVTSGDRWSRGGGDPVGKGMFVRELELALLRGEAHVAVHSAKDLPTDLPEGLELLATPRRADPRDVLVGAAGLDDLPPGARVGTGSSRRAAQLTLRRPDLEIVPIRGNVETRLRRRSEGVVDAVVLAAAGLARLGLAPAECVPLEPDVWVPAPGQGVLALEGRVGDEVLRAALAALDDPPTHRCLDAERALLEGLGGGCRAPVGALCSAKGDELILRAFWAPEAAAAVRGERRGSLGRPEEVGAALADALRAEAAA